MFKEEQIDALTHFKKGLISKIGYVQFRFVVKDFANLQFKSV